ncbi:MAG: PilZ domain-containing protein [Sandaracinaceae bacterium]|jgi:uncharacterized protein (TIGR02266 family)|nr:PilZ domain-containing protein [Sandaracinaceae bacterium]
MTYSGATAARTAREELGQALEALQKDPNIPPDVLNVAQNCAQAVGQLFEAEKAADETAGKAAVKQALGSLSQTLALLQDVRSQHPGTTGATEAIAKVMGVLFPLTSAPSKFPPAGSIRPSTEAGTGAGGIRTSLVPAPAPYDGPRQELEANIGANTESNFFVGFSGEIAEGGVFIATYTSLERNTPVSVLVTLPGGFETKLNGRVRWVRDPMDFTDESEPGMGIQFESLAADTRELILRFIKKRPPIFYDE